MRLFIDSADPRLWARYRRSGWLFGATTNPLILQRAGEACYMATYRRLVAAARDAGLDELQIQTTGRSVGEMRDTGLEIAGLWPQVVVKVPLTAAGMQAAASLIARDIRVTLTAAHAAHQMIAATAIGAAYIAPYYGRMAADGDAADRIMADMARIRDRAAKAPRILVASLRKIEQVEALAAAGQDTFTLNPELAEQFGLDAMSDRAATEFEQASGGKT